MKSAYEIAMEKLNAASGPSKKLTDDQKNALADIETTYKARIAEVRLDIEGKTAGADPETRASLHARLADEIVRFEEKCEAEKEAVWNEAGG